MWWGILDRVGGVTGKGVDYVIGSPSRASRYLSQFSSPTLAPLHYSRCPSLSLMATRELLSGPITLSEAKESGFNVVHQLEYPKLQRAFFQRLQSQRQLIRTIVAHHLGADQANCDISSPEYWRHGSFNVCVPACVNRPDPGPPTFIMVRFPLPYRVGETTHPGNADEKLRCEAATYAWLEEHCPSVPIPHLYGIGLATGQQVRLAAYGSHLRAR
jgi:hypothetical protein